MTIQIKCPCGTTLKLKDEALGRTVHCRRCRKAHRVPLRHEKTQSPQAKAVRSSENIGQYSIHRSWLGDEITATDSNGNIVLRADVEGRELFGIRGSRLSGLVMHTLLMSFLLGLVGWWQARALGFVLWSAAGFLVGYLGSYCYGLWFDVLKWRRTVTIYEPGQKKPLLRVQPVEGTLTERRFELSGRAGRGRIVANRNQLLGPLTRIYFTLNGSQLLTVELQEPEREPAGCLSVLAALTMAPVIKIILVILLFPLVALAIFIEGNAPLAAMVRVIAAVIGIAVAAACVILPVLNAIGVFKFTWLWFRDQSGEQRFALASRGFFGHCLIPEEKPASPELCLIVSLLRIARIPSQFMGECQIADAGLQPLSLLKKKEAWQ